jgi:hypothetical protein
MYVFAALLLLQTWLLQLPYNKKPAALSRRSQYAGKTA